MGAVSWLSDSTISRGKETPHTFGWYALPKSHRFNTFEGKASRIIRFVKRLSSRKHLILENIDKICTMKESHRVFIKIPDNAINY